MKYLKSYKVFENSGSGNAQFDLLRKQNNERFFKLADILYSEVFDEYGVIEKKDESFDGQVDPTHKFWGFNLVNGGFVKNKSEIIDTDSIQSIFVYNIPENEESEFFELLKSLDERVFDYCEKHLVITQESYVNNDIYFDFIISFGDEPSFYECNENLKTFKLFESVSEKTVTEKLYDITDDSNFKVNIEYASRDGVKESMIVFISRGSYRSRKTREIPGAADAPGGYPDNLFLWFEIKDAIIGLCEYVYSETDTIDRIQHPFRMFNGGVEFGIGWNKAEDFTLGDFISFTSLKLVIKL